MTDDVKFCKDCKFFKVGWFDKLINYNRFGKCTKFVFHAVKDEERFYLVSGIKTERKDFYYASTVRSYYCGKEAQWYEPKK
jgi:hypothetical protein